MSFDPTYVVVLLCLIFTQQSLSKCPIGWDEHGTKCFIPVGGKLDFQNAKTQCNSLNAQLPEPRSQTEFDRLRQVQVSEYWLGIRNLGLVSNQTFSYVSDNVTVSYSDWKISEEPSSHLGAAVCTIFKDGRWQAGECDQIRNIVCEAISCPDDYTRKGKKCYTLVDERKTYEEAAEACKVRSGRLAEESIGILEMLRDSPPADLIGMSNLLWIHSKGDSMSRCVSIDKKLNKKSLTYRTGACSNKNSFVCESGIDGGVSAWKAWSGCSVSCGGGVRHRRRDCDNPEPQYGGRQCDLHLSGSEVCGTMDCGGTQEGINDSENQKGTSCQSSPSPCGHGNHKCISLTDAEYTCECGKGYALENKLHPTCREVNKCESSKDICQSGDGSEHKCVNAPGSKHSYRCECQKGYTNLDDIFCAPDVERPKRPDWSLPDMPLVKGVAFSLNTYILLFFVWVIFMDVRFILAVIYRYCTTEPVPDTDSDCDDEEVIICTKDQGYTPLCTRPTSKYWQTEDNVLEERENIWSARVSARGSARGSKILLKIPEGQSISGGNVLGDIPSSLQINSVESRIQSNHLTSRIQSNHLTSRIQSNLSPTTSTATEVDKVESFD